MMKGFCGNISLKVGDGSMISFWVHKWCGENMMREVFPNLYCVSFQREKKTVQQIRGSHEGLFTGT